MLKSVSTAWEAGGLPGFRCPIYTMKRNCITEYRLASGHSSVCPGTEREVSCRVEEWVRLR